MNKVFIIMKYDCDGTYVQFVFTTFQFAKQNLQEIYNKLNEECKDIDDFSLELKEDSLNLWYEGMGAVMYYIVEKEITK